ncbi:MAG: hypothetical protein A2V70_17685 [Planctomycetes bacterium RBG_13_63_9]|nr:MAG: hypothetical protein A2V70_17685 [Planctomycetes bacterium RBG_13_63_9]
MTKIRLPIGVLFLVMGAAVGLPGCQTIDFHGSSPVEPVPPMMEPPREKSLMSLPAYRIEVPDVLQIEMLKQVPLPPYRVEAYDVLKISVVGTLPDQSINDYYLVEGEGTVNLGPAYGTVRVVGLTLDETQETIDQHLRRILTQPEVSVQLAQAYGSQPVTGEYLVGPDGTVNLRQYGSVPVAGMTVSQAKSAIEKHLEQYFDSPELSVNVINYNSKFYYVITQGAGLGDNVVKVPITGKETVLDAITQVGGISQLSSTDLWIARPSPGDSGYEQILPIDYEAITRGGCAATNYQLMQGDRVFIAEDKTVTLTNVIAKMTAPFEQLAGTLSLGTNTIRGTQMMGRGYNRSFRR